MLFDQSELEWSQPGTWRREYQLTKDGEAIATLRFEKSGGSLATGVCGDQTWTLKRTGFLSPRVLVRESGSSQDLAIYTPSWTGRGWLVFNSGRRYHLRPLNFWATEWAFEAEDGTPTVTLTGPHGVLKQGGRAKVAESAASLPETPIMLILIWYLRILMNEDASAAAVIASSS